jgi:methyl-accepting chemotaxis protein
MKKSMSIRTRLLAGFFLLAIIVCVIGYIGITKINRINNEDIKLDESVAKPLGQLASMMNDFQKLGAIYRDTYIEKDKSERQISIQNQNELLKSFENKADLFEKTIISDDDKKIFGDLKSNLSDFKKVIVIYNSNLLDKKDEEALSLRKSIMHNYADAMEKSLNELLRAKIIIGNNISENNSGLANASTIFMTILIFIGLIGSVILGLLISNNINNLIKKINHEVKRITKAAIDGKLEVRGDPEKINEEFRLIIVGMNETMDAVINPLNVAANYVDRISVGDMPDIIRDEYRGDFNKIKNNLNSMIQAINQIVEKAKLVTAGDLTVSLEKRSEKDELMISLNDMVKSTSYVMTEFRKAADSIAAASLEISSGSQQMSQGATEQASSAEEVSSSMEEMVSNIDQNTDNAQQTEKIAVAASDGIREGNRSVEISVNAMKDIAEKIKIINDLSFQTNILALNAAVEAARAGEHGRGFAVVAAEVRKLAERSKAAADDIDELSRNGVNVSIKAGEQLANLVPEIEKTTKLVQEITAASIEQNSGAGQINNAIQQLNQVTQQNAAAAEEMATNAEELSSQAEQLKEIIAYFKLNNDLSAAPISPKVLHTQQNWRKDNKINFSQFGGKNQASVLNKKIKGADIKLHSNMNDSDYQQF